nr:DUF2878 domain-containing protein [Marinobacter salicampi]
MIRSDTVRSLVNLLLFQLGWFLCVLFPGLLSATAAFGLVGIHLALVSQHRSRELQFILLGTVLGSLLDGLWFQLGVMTDSSGTVFWTPVWLVGMWALFLTTLAHSLSWMGSRPWLPFVLAPIAGPFAYWSASELGAVVLPAGWSSLLALALGWLVIFPLLMYIRKRFYPEITS